MLWRAARVVLEADGKVKYTGRELWREKLRQERLERLGYRVVRALWSDVTARPDELVQRVRSMTHTPPSWTR
jgi:very-short-patch-repair endonuclease